MQTRVVADLESVLLQDAPARTRAPGRLSVFDLCASVAENPIRHEQTHLLVPHFVHRSLRLRRASAAQDSKKLGMTPNKQTVQAYMDAFNKTDHVAILACLTEDVEWFIPGRSRRRKSGVRQQIESDAFVGHPIIKVARMTEENDVVVAEGNVRCTRKDGVVMHIEFCDVFEMRGAKIKRLVSYLMEVKD
jgi:ketosteroid isomerase-like protein